MSSRVWVITGTNSGLGLALARYVLSKGDKVVATVRSRSKFPQELEALGATPLLLDLHASDEKIKQAAEEALGAYGHVDALVNNAASVVGGVQPVEELSMEDTRSIFQVNLCSLLAFTQPFITYFRMRRSGHIINISSRAGLTSVPSMGGYSATKAALNAFTDSLHAELAPYSVRVTTILPGFYPTPILLDAPEQSLSKVYTDPETQGYNIVKSLPAMCAARGWVGDETKFGARVYEIVTNTGMAKEVDVEKNDIRKIFLGLDAGILCGEDLEKMLHELRILRPLWSSTNATSAKL